MHASRSRTTQRSRGVSRSDVRRPAPPTDTSTVAGTEIATPTSVITRGRSPSIRPATNGTSAATSGIIAVAVESGPIASAWWRQTNANAAHRPAPAPHARSRADHDSACTTRSTTAKVITLTIWATMVTTSGAVRLLDTAPAKSDAPYETLHRVARRTANIGKVVPTWRTRRPQRLPSRRSTLTAGVNHSRAVRIPIVGF